MPALLWDIQEEHLSEAEFTFELWHNSLDSPAYTLREVEDGPESRLQAHVAGLVVGGAAVRDRLLLPVLAEADDDRFRTAAATLAVVGGSDAEARERVLEALATAGAEGRWGLVRGLQLARRRGIGRWLVRDLGQVEGPALAGRLGALAYRGYDPRKRLIAWLDSGDPEVQRAAAHLARHTSSAGALRSLVPLMHAGDEGLRRDAVESALIRGLPGSWQAACELAFSRSEHEIGEELRRAALAWVAMLGDADAHARLLALARDQPSSTTLWALAITGRPDAVDFALELVDHPTLARAAGELLAAIAGLPLDDRRCWLDDGDKGAFGHDPDEALPQLEDDDLDAELVPAEERGLHLPNPAACRAWWAERELEFSPAIRYLRGRPIDGAGLEAGLRELPTRRRHPLALELAMRSAGAQLIDPRAPAATQRVQLAKAFAQSPSKSIELDCQRGLPMVSS